MLGRTNKLDSPGLSIRLTKKTLEAPSSFKSQTQLVQVLIDHLPVLVKGWQRFIKLRPHNRQEVYLYLRSRLARQIVIEGDESAFWSLLLDQLAQAGWVTDDYRFALFWIESRQHSTPRSAFGIKYELVRKGVPEAVIDQALKDSGYDSFEALKALYRRYRHKSWPKFVQAARRHGFDYQEIKQLKPVDPPA